jgi:alpha-glucosidase
MATLNSGRWSGKSSVWEFVHPDGREHDVWYVGGITGEDARDVSVKLDFLQPGLKYEAAIYADAPDADYETNPQAYTITRKKVNAKTTLKLHMARAGGFAISIRSMK